MSETLRILLLADPYVEVPPRLYGGIERIIDLLVRGLHRAGHQVTLVARPGSSAPAELLAYGVPPHRGLLPRARELGQVWSAVQGRAGVVDVIHSFARLGGLAPVLHRHRVPKVQSYQRGRIRELRHLKVATRLAGPSLALVGCSESLFVEAQRQGVGAWRRIFNAVELERYPFAAQVDGAAPLVFLGRLEREKGPHHAIAIARRAGRPLVLAGNVVRDGGEPDFFEREIAPFLDEASIRYIGPVDDAQKAELLGRAAALLMPIEVEEAFGIVMAEALACGTPVIAFRRGATPEVVRHGTTGFLCDGIDEAARAVAGIAALDRKEARRDCAARFSSEVVVAEYVSLYRELMERCAAC